MKTLSGKKETTELTIINLFRNSKIGDLDASLVVDEDIGAFDITMNDIAFMEINQA